MDGRAEHCLYFVLRALIEKRLSRILLLIDSMNAKKNLHYCGEQGFVVETGQQAVSTEFGGGKNKGNE